MRLVPIIIDTDPGIDDVLAIATAFCVPSFDIQAISTVKGNVSLDSTTNNACLTLDILEKETPVFKGSRKSFINIPSVHSNVHGNDGLGNLYDSYRIITPKIDRKLNGLTELSHFIGLNPEPITIISLGPLTNLAHLLMMSPNLKNNVKALYIMGGGLSKGNISDLAEFNFYCDSYAVRKVLESGIDIVLVTLDATSQVYFTQDEFDLYKPVNKQARFIKQTLAHYINLDPYLHDVLAVLALSNPELFEFDIRNLDVLISSGIANGMIYPSEKRHEGTLHITKIKSREAIVKCIFDYLNTYNV